MENDGLNTWTEEAYWDVPGTYVYELTFKNFDELGEEGSVEITEQVEIVIAGDAVSSSLSLSANGGAEDTSAIWPEFDGSFDEDYINEESETRPFYLDAYLRFYDADGNQTHIDDMYQDFDMAYEELAFQNGYWYSDSYSELDWGQNLWIMSNEDSISGTEYDIHPGGSAAAEYTDEHEEEFGYGFNYTDLKFLVPGYDSFEGADNSEEEMSYSYDMGLDDNIYVVGLVDDFGDFTGNPHVKFLVGGEWSGEYSFWVRYDAGSFEITTTSGDAFDSNQVDIDLREWAGNLSTNTTVIDGEGIVEAQNDGLSCWIYCADANWMVRDDVGTLDYVYDGDAGTFIDLPVNDVTRVIDTLNRAAGDNTLVVNTSGDINLEVGDSVELEWGNITIDGTYVVASVIDQDEFTVETTANTLFSEVGGTLTVLASLPYSHDSLIEYNFDNEDGVVDTVLLTNTDGSLTLTYDLAGAASGDEYLLSFESFAYGDISTRDQLIIRSEGFYPQYRLQDTEEMSGPLFYGDMDYDETNAPYIYREFAKSYEVGDTLNLTYQVTDAWNDPIVNLASSIDWYCFTYNDGDCDGDVREATFDPLFDNYELTDADGMVSFTITNTNTIEELALEHGCETVINCQEEHQADGVDYEDMWRQAWIYAMPNIHVDVQDDLYESDWLGAEFSRSVEVDDLLFYAEGGSINVDSLGQNQEARYAQVAPVNSDGVHLSGLDWSASVSEGGFLMSGLCDGEYDWDDWGSITGSNGNCYDGYISEADFIDVTLFEGTEDEGTGSRKLLEFEYTGTLTDLDVTFTVTVGGVTESVTTDVYNDVADRRFVDGLVSDEVIAGDIATATFLVTDRFGNPVADVDMDFWEFGYLNFVISDEDSQNETDEFDTTDADGLVSVDVLTPAVPNSGTEAVMAEFDSSAPNGGYAPASVDSAEVDITWNPELFGLGITVVGDGTVQADAGFSCTDECEEDIIAGTVVSLTAVADEGWEFAGWSGVCVGTGACIITMDAAKDVTATFTEIPTFDLNIEVIGSGTVQADAGFDCTDECTETLVAGTVVSLTAVADEGWVFAGWSGVCVGTGLCLITLDAAKDVTATFTEIPTYDLNIDVIGSGTVQADKGFDCTDECTEALVAGTLVSLTAVAADGWEFAGWSGVCVGTGACIITMDAEKDVVATFTEIPAPPAPSITIKALKYKTGFKVFTSNSAGLVTRVYVDGKLKETFVPSQNNSFNKYLLKKGGKRTIVVTIDSASGVIFETVVVKLKK